MDVRPRRVALGDGWPLDGNGRMTCLTCHVDCGRHALASDDTSTSRSFLRGNAVARQFCERCHRPRERGGRAIAHGRVFPIAHPRAALVASGGSDASVIDGASRICLGCHDGTIGVAAESLGLERPVPGADLTSHPVGVPQPVTSERTGDTWLVPRESVDPRIVLDGEGRLGCLSCHDLYSREAGLLVMSNRESGLCFGCHEL